MDAITYAFAAEVIRAVAEAWRHANRRSKDAEFRPLELSSLCTR